MISFSKVYKYLRLVVIVMIELFLSVSTVYPETTSSRKKGDMLRFDTIIELNAPILGTHVTIFGRYWVTPTSYSAGVLWAEPHISNINFPTYPPSLNIHSDEQSFSLANQISTGNNLTFPKPIGRRRIFYNKLNVYTLANIRFAESEAIASRVYAGDVRTAVLSGSKIVALPSRETNNINTTDITKLSLETKNGQIGSLSLLDPNGQLVKKIEYEYARNEGHDVLKRQNILLPERTMMMGYQGGGVTLRVCGKKQTYKVIPGSHHSGGRKCIVEYKPLRVDNRVLSLPNRITVRKGSTTTILRISRMFNYVELEMDNDEARQAATQFSRLDNCELKVRALWDKYWEQDTDTVEEPDIEVIKQLRSKFESSKVSRRTIGHELKRINMLIVLDWIQGNDAGLHKHFKQYLGVLNSSGLKDTALDGGLNLINSTVRWHRFSAADGLLAYWIDNAIANCDAGSILSFAHTKIRRRHCWIVASLLQECTKISRGWKTKCFNAQALRCKALYDLSVMIQDTTKKKSSSVRSQADWVSKSMSKKDLLMTVRRSVVRARKLFDKLADPTPIQRKLMRAVDRLEGTINQIEN